jgi:hypothetical protein
VSWLGALRRYIAAGAALHLGWEIAQLPLYTLWATDSLSEKAYAVLHCTLGDVLIALAALGMALVVAGASSWPAERFVAVAAVTVAAGLSYTVYSEWLNVSVRGSWAYSALMPALPPLGTGAAPLAQWLVVPAAALWAARRPRPPRRTRSARGTLHGRVPVA